MGGFSGSLGSVFVDVDGDLSKLQSSLKRALPEAQKLGEEISTAVSSGIGKSGAGTSADLAKRIGDAFAKAKGPVDELGEAYKTLGLKSTKELGRAATEAFNAFEKIRTSGTASAADIERAFEKMEAADKKWQDSLRTRPPIVEPGAIQKLEALAGSIDKFGSAASSLGTKLSIGLTVPLAGLATASIKAAADMDALERGLIAVTGSATEAKRQLDEMREVSKLPGLGLKEAVEGSINLQALGFSADKTKNILLAFGNALATVGRGKEDLNETIRQLGQLGARGVVTADNLRPIIERVPQVAGIIKREFGGEALSDPAKRFKELGISASDFIDILVRELLKLPKVTSSLKNDLENFQQALFESFAKIGKELTPFVSQFTSTAVPALQKAIEIFSALPEPVKQSAIVLGIFSAAFGPVIGAIGQMAGALNSTIKLLGIFAVESRAAAAAQATLNTASGASGVTGSMTVLSRILTPVNVGLLGISAAALVTASNLNKLEKAADTAFDEGLKKLSPEKAKQFTDRLAYMGLSVEQFKNLSIEDLEKVRDKFQQFDQFKAPVTGFTVTVEGATKAVTNLADAHDKTGAASDKHAAKATYGATAFERFTVAASKLGNAFRDIPVKIPLIEELPPQIDVARLRMEELREEIRHSREVLDELNDADLSALADEFDRAADRFRNLFDVIKDGKDVLHDLTVGSQREVDAIGDIFDDAAKRQGISVKKQGEAVNQLGRQVSTVMTDMSRDITKVIFEGGKLGDVFKKTGVAISEAIVRYAIERGTQLLLDQLEKILKQIPVVGAVFGKVFGATTPSFSGAPIPGIGGDTGRSATGAAGSPLGGGAAASAASGALGIVNVVTGAVSAITGVIGNIQNIKIEKTLSLIEESTRYIKIWTGERPDSMLQTQHSMLESLRRIEASTFGQVKVNLSGTLDTNQTNLLIDRLLNGSVNFYSESLTVMRDLRNISAQGFAQVAGELNQINHPGIVKQLTGSLLGGLGPGIGGAINSATGGLTGILAGLGSAVSSLFQGGEKDRLNIIANKTSGIDYALNDGGMRIATLNIRDDLHNFVEGAFGGWFHASFASLVSTVESIAAMKESGTKDVAAGAGTFVINVYGSDPKMTIEAISTYLRPLGYRYQAR